MLTRKKMFEHIFNITSNSEVQTADMVLSFEESIQNEVSYIWIKRIATKPPTYTVA